MLKDREGEGEGVSSFESGRLEVRKRGERAERYIERETERARYM